MKRRCRLTEQTVRGFSLLELVLALAILAGSLAALGEVMRLADRNSAAARDETQAQVLADSVMAELIASARPLANVATTQFELDVAPRWMYTITVEPTQYNELVLVRVAVVQDLPSEQRPVRVELVRWFPNPDYAPTGSNQSTTGADSGASQSAFGNQSGEQR